MSNRQNKRVRGLILSPQGWQKLQDAKIEWEFAEKQGYKVTESFSYEDFLKKLKNKFDLALVNGFVPRSKILEAIKGKKMKCIYFVSENIPKSELELYENVISIGNKPFDINVFIRKVNRVLNKK